MLEKILAHFHQLKIKQLYLSNDIDGTDMAEAPATGTPEKEGLTAQFVLALSERAKKEFDLIGGDVVEVAPPLSGEWDFAQEKTSLLGAQYLNSLIK